MRIVNFGRLMEPPRVTYERLVHDGKNGWLSLRPRQLPRWKRPGKQSRYMPHQGKREVARRLERGA